MGERNRYQSGYDRDRTRSDNSERYEQRRPRQWGSGGSAENDQREDRDRYAGYYSDRQYGTRGPDEREEGSHYGAEEWRSRSPYEGGRRYSEDADQRQLEGYRRDWQSRGQSDYDRSQGSGYSSGYNQGFGYNQRSGYTPGPYQSRPYSGSSTQYGSPFRQSESYNQGYRDQSSQQRDWRTSYNHDDEHRDRGGEHESFGEQVREAGHRIARSVKRAFRGPKGYKRSDDRIREDVSDRLGDHEYLDVSEVEVTVSNGEVTLTGTVRTRQEKFLAEEIADDISGVNDVHNQLRVKRDQTQSTTETSSSQNAASGIEGVRPRNARA